MRPATVELLIQEVQLRAPAGASTHTVQPTDELRERLIAALKTALGGQPLPTSERYLPEVHVRLTQAPGDPMRWDKLATAAAEHIAAMLAAEPAGPLPHPRPPTPAAPSNEAASARPPGPLTHGVAATVAPPARR